MAQHEVRYRIAPGTDGAQVAAELKAAKAGSQARVVMAIHLGHTTRLGIARAISLGKTATDSALAQLMGRGVVERVDDIAFDDIPDLRPRTRPASVTQMRRTHGSAR